MVWEIDEQKFKRMEKKFRKVGIAGLARDEFPLWQAVQAGSLKVVKKIKPLRRPL